MKSSCCFMYGILLVVLMNVFCAAAEVEDQMIVEDQLFHFSQMPDTLFAQVKRGDDIEFKLEENSSTGYRWHYVKEGLDCKVEIKHHQVKSDMVGVPGYAEIELDPRSDKPQTITLYYSRTGKNHDADVIKRVKIRLNYPEDAAKVKFIDPDDRVFSLKAISGDLPLRAMIARGKDCEFKVENLPGVDGKWQLLSGDQRFCKVRLEQESWRSVRVTEIKIKGEHPGETELIFVGGRQNPQKFSVKVVVVP